MIREIKKRVLSKNQDDENNSCFHCAYSSMNQNHVKGTINPSNTKKAKMYKKSVLLIQSFLSLVFILLLTTILPLL